MNVSNRIKRMFAAVPGVLWLKNALGLRSSLLRVPVTFPADRGAPPSVAEDDLQAEYQSRAVASQPDTFVLYRIIGNDLYPRHRKGQCRDNLRFILENEPPLEACEKRFIVNRIYDPDEERQVLEMLRAAGVPFTHIPFNPREYGSVPWDIHGVPAEYAPHTRNFERLHETHQERVIMRMYRHKNNYVMNNNGARNTALAEGRGVAKWALPWDGNCFVTEEGWREIREGVVSNPHYAYHVVPMARIVDNAQVLQPGFRPTAEEEPQIVFRCDTNEMFDQESFYGRRPKVELLWRLGVPGKWDYWTIEPWDVPCPAYSREAGQWRYSGWVARLSSGKPQLEQGGKSLKDRGRARVEAVAAAIDRIDEQVFGQTFDWDKPVYVSSTSSADSSSLVAKLETAAAEALSRGPYSVVDKTTLPPSRDPHDYWHPAPYYWPNPIPIPGLPYVRRDGERAPGTRMYEPASEQYDRTRLQRLFDDTFVLALAHARTERQEFAEHAARLVRHWFLEPETAMNPHLRFAAAHPGRKRPAAFGAGIIEAKDLYYFLDAVRLLSAAGVLSGDEQAQLKTWFSDYLVWLTTSGEGARERSRPNNHGTYYDLHVAAVAAYVGDYLTLRNTFRDARFRIVQQFNSNGEQPEELSRTTTAHYCCFNLQGWIHLAELGRHYGEDLWSFEGPRGESLQKAMRWLLQYMHRDWPYEQIVEFDRARFLPIHHAYYRIYGNVCGVDASSVPSASETKAIFHPHDGIRPFWQLR